MKIDKKLEQIIKENNIEFIIKDCESISKEIDINNLEINYNVEQLDFGTKKGKLLFYTLKDRKIVATKNYNYTLSPIININLILANNELKLK